MDRLLGIRHSSAAFGTISGGDELTEDDVFWSTYDHDSHENRRRFPSPEPAITNRHRSFSPSSGILAVLPERWSDYQQVLCRKPIVPSRVGQSIPRRAGRQQDKGNNNRMMQQQQQSSAPVSVPLLSRSRRFIEVEEWDAAEDNMVLPPHEIVARGSGVSPKTTFSVLEGAGRTLKGRDLRQVRNAVFRRTGFID